MHLVKPTPKYAESWKEALKELEAEGTKGFWNIPEKPTTIEEYIQRTKDHKEGKNLPDYWVPASTYWLIDNDIFVGHVNIRHELTEKLKKLGGHIGYAIRPTERKKGYGTKILELALKEARKIGLKRILLTCDDNNIPSQKIIEKKGGNLKDKVTVEGKVVRRYWIDI